LSSDVSVAVVEDGQLLDTPGAGIVVPWWSFSKTVIAAAALRLVQDGALALDAPVEGRPYSLRQLLQHRSGLGDYGSLGAYHEAVARDDDPWPVSVLLERVGADRLCYPPGKGWEYSNVGYLVVRRLIEAAAGAPLRCALQGLVCDPLRVRDVQLASERRHLDRIEPGATGSYHPGWVYHGLLVGPLGQAAVLLDRLIRGALLTPDLLVAMQDVYELEGPVAGRPWRQPGYGLGLMIGTTTTGSRVLGHTGGGPGSVCAIYHDLARARTVAAFATGEDPSGVESAAFGYDA
jgi:CubicO group peptidase (beta-lactamase class C family)